MSFARVFYPASGTDYSVPFSYQDQSEVLVFVAGVAQQITLVWSFLNANTIRFLIAPTGVVEIRRNTQKTTNKTTFADTAIDVASARNLEDTQLLYSVEEAFDLATDALGIDETDGVSLSARNKRITNLADPVGAKDATNEEWVLAHTVSDNSAGAFTAHSERIVDLADPTFDTDAATKGWVLAHTVSDNGGGAMTAHNDRVVDVAGPVATTDATNKQYVDSAINSAFVDKLGTIGKAVDGINWDAKSKRIENVADPTVSQDAATKQYVDTAVLAEIAGAGVTLATLAEAQAGTNNSHVMTPVRTFDAIDSHRPLATTAEAQAGSNATDVMTPARTFEAVRAATMVAAGASHKAGSVPDPGATAGLKRVFGDDGAFHGASDQRLWAQPAAGKVCLLSDYGLVTGPTPGVNNATLLNSVFALATEGDTFVLPTTGSLGSLGQLTYFTARPNPVPEKCTLRGANKSPSSSGVVRSYTVADFREPFITLSPESCTVEDMTIYINDGFSSGSAIGVVQTTSQFIIHPRIRNVHTTCLGTTASWAMPLCLDGSASDGVTARGIREARVEDCAFWQYNTYGMYLQSCLGGIFTGMTLTPALVGGVPVAVTADISLGGNATVPSYSNVIVGGQIGIHTIVGKATNNLIMGGFGKVTFNDAGSLDNKFMDHTYSFDPEFNAGASNVVFCGDRMFTSSGLSIGTHQVHGTPVFKIMAWGGLIAPGGIAAQSFVDVSLSVPGARVSDMVTVIQPLWGAAVALTCTIVANDTVTMRVHNYGAAPVSLGDTSVGGGIVSFTGT